MKQYKGFLLIWVGLLAITSLQAQYCNPVVTGSAANTGITNFTISNLNHNSPDMEGYVDYTGFSATVYRNSIYNLYIHTANPAMQDAGVWVDWNQDNDFADPGEKICGPARYNNAAPHIERIRIPATANIGSTRLRVVANLYGSPIDSCTTTQAVGDIEDYTLIIRDTVYATSTQYLSPQFISPATEKKVLGIEVFSSTNFSLTSATFNITGTSNPGAISNAKLFYSGDDYSFANTQFGGTVAVPAGSFVINGAQMLQPGLNYFWLTYDVNGNSGDVIDAQLENLVVNSITILPAVSSPPQQLTIKSPVCNYNPKRNNIWYFGTMAGIDFNGPPAPLTNNVIDQHEGSASIADKNGNLLFYTDGDKMYDRTHTQMPNGFNMGGNVSTTQSAIIIQQPDNDSIYYVFTQKHQAFADSLGETAGFYYSIVDMSKNGGLGDVIIKRTVLLNFSLEKQNAIMHSNQKDVWIICHEFNNNSYYAYLLTATDLKDPVVTNTGMVITNELETLGCIKISRDGTKVAAAIAGNHPSIGNRVELFDFSTTTGILSGIKTLTITGNACPYGVEFSPNGNLLYVSENCSGILGQYDATLTTGALVYASKVTLAASGITGALELAPDGRIYCAKVATSIGVINSPNVAGAGCGFMPNAFNLSGRFCKIGLPNNFIPAAPPAAMAGSAVSVCPGTSAQLTASGGPAYSWLPSHGISSLNNYTVTVTPTSTTTYSFVVSNNGSCPDTATVNITVHPEPILTVTGDTVVCNGIANTLSASGASSYSWLPGSGLSNSTGAVVNTTTTAFTSYTITGIDGNGCADTTTIDINVGNPVVVITGDTAICPGISTSLTASGANSYTWSPSTGLSATTGNISNANPPVATHYTVTGIDIFGCTDSASFTIITTGVSVSITGTPVICSGDSTTLTAVGATGYSWFPSQGLSASTGSTPGISPASNTTYTVIGVNSAGCADTTTVFITVNPLPIVSVSDDDTICLGSMASLSAGGGTIYQWNPTAGLSAPAAAATSASPVVTTPYTVDVSDGNCVASGTVVITVMDLPVVSTSGNATILPGGSAVISANGGGTYSWMPANSLSCASCQSPVASPSVTTTYYVLVTDENGCSTMDSLTIEIDRLCDDIYVPNAFSPNGDGQNDVFKILGSCITDLHLVIFDRWGEKVFETNDLSFEWDGNHKGKELNSAVFSYMLNVNLYNNESFFHKGNLSLVR